MNLVVKPVFAIARRGGLSIDCRAARVTPPETTYDMNAELPAQTADELLMAQRLVQVLGLEHITPESIQPSAPLFGSSLDSVGLDSIDALEIALMIQQHYGVELRSDDVAVRAAFGSLRSLTEYALHNRVAG
jgi:acyl carrier protein